MFASESLKIFHGGGGGALFYTTSYYTMFVVFIWGINGTSHSRVLFNRLFCNSIFTLMCTRFIFNDEPFDYYCYSKCLFIWKLSFSHPPPPSPLLLFLTESTMLWIIGAEHTKYLFKIAWHHYYYFKKRRTRLIIIGFEVISCIFYQKEVFLIIHYDIYYYF